jgi:hypothetical protein
MLGKKALMYFIGLTALPSLSQAQVIEVEKPVEKSVVRREVIKPEVEKGSIILSIAGVVNDQVEQVKDGRENREVNVGGGILVEANVNETFGIETGALFIRHQYDLDEKNFRLVQHVDRIHVPIAARFWPTDYLSLAAGPFVSFRTGDVRNALSKGDEAENARTAAHEDVEYGLDAALTLNFAVNRKTGIFLEGRYSSLFEQFRNEDSDQVSALAGLKLDL